VKMSGSWGRGEVKKDPAKSKKGSSTTGKRAPDVLAEESRDRHSWRGGGVAFA